MVAGYSRGIAIAVVAVYSRGSYRSSVAGVAEVAL